MAESHRRRSGFKERTRLAAARARLREAVEVHDRVERVALGAADGRTLAAPVDAERDVPHYARAAMDGYAVRAEDTFGASDRAPASLRVGERVGSGRAVRVHTGSALPEGADAVVMVEHVEAPGDPAGGAESDRDEEIEVFDAVAVGENVGPVGEDVEAGRRLFEPGHRLRPSDLGLLRAVGVETVAVYGRPTVAVVPTGEELVMADEDREPGPGEIVETNGLTVSRYVDRWGGEATYRRVVTDDPDALRAAIQRDLTHDLIVTTGGSSVGERDLVPEVVEDLGEVLVHGVALRPGHPVALGLVEDTPVLMLPGYPVACIVNAVQFLRPAVKWAGGMPLEPLPAVPAKLTRKVRSEPGIRTFARVELEAAGGDDEGGDADDDGNGGTEDGTPTPLATPTRSSGAGVLSSVALADGWVVVPEGTEGYAAGEVVAIENWEWSA